VQGQGGSGKTHLLGQIRERVQAAGGYVLLVELLDSASFWQSVRSGIIESLGRPGAQRETQVKDLLSELSSIAHVSRADRRAIIGDDDLEPDTLDRFVNALATARRDPVPNVTKHCARSYCWEPRTWRRTMQARPTCSPARRPATMIGTTRAFAHHPRRRNYAFSMSPG
jgi:hypothetical protein